MVHEPPLPRLDVHADQVAADGELRIETEATVVVVGGRVGQVRLGGRELRVDPGQTAGRRRRGRAQRGIAGRGARVGPGGDGLDVRAAQAPRVEQGLAVVGGRPGRHEPGAHDAGHLGVVGQRVLVGGEREGSDPAGHMAPEAARLHDRLHAAVPDGGGGGSGGPRWRSRDGRGLRRAGRGRAAAGRRDREDHECRQRRTADAGVPAPPERRHRIASAPILHQGSDVRHDAFRFAEATAPMPFDRAGPPPMGGRDDSKVLLPIVCFRITPHELASRRGDARSMEVSE